MKDIKTVFITILISAVLSVVGAMVGLGTWFGLMSLQSSGAFGSWKLLPASDYDPTFLIFTFIGSMLGIIAGMVLMIRHVRKRS